MGIDIIGDMSRIADEILRLFPLLAPKLSPLSADSTSDSHLMRELASYVVDLFETGHIEEVLPAFDMAERLIVEGPGPQRDAAIIGFLETVQNVASHRRCGMAAFEEFLGPSSQCAWAELTNVWRDKTRLAEVVAAETGAKIRPRWWQFWKREDRRTPAELLGEVENPELRKIIEQITRE
jgi:hypothetical protein